MKIVATVLRDEGDSLVIGHDGDSVAIDSVDEVILLTPHEAESLVEGLTKAIAELRPISSESRDELVEILERTLSELFVESTSAVAMLRSAGFPASSIPSFSSPRIFWSRVCTYAKNGIMRYPWRSLVLAALAQYPHHMVLQDLRRRFSARSGS